MADFVKGSKALQSLAISQMIDPAGSLIKNLFDKEKPKDPYNLDFTKLRKHYVDETTIKIPFVKSSFVHYSKCPLNMKINGKEY